MKRFWNHIRFYWREWLLGFLMLAPFVLVLPTAGIAFLWQQGWFWYWPTSVVAFTLIPLVAIRAFWNPRAHGVSIAAADSDAAPAERQARNAMEVIIAGVTAEDVRTADSGLNLILRSVNAVATAFTPEGDALPEQGLAGLSKAALRFTLPEILLMNEELARKLRETLTRDLPMTRQVEVGWALDTYETGTSIAEPAMQLARAARWVNPLSAIQHELVGFALSNAINQLGAHAKAQVAAYLAREVGEAAIRLYSGHYRRRADELLATAPKSEAPRAPDPLTIVLSGQRNAGKSSLLNALLGVAQAPVGLTRPSEGFTAYRLAMPEIGDLILVDSPGLDQMPRESWLKQARQTDLILWVVAANRADRAADQRGLAKLRELTASDPRLRAIPLVLVATQADRLDPPLEWSPPYDPLTGTRPKEVAMRAALEAAARKLNIPIARSVTVAAPPDAPPWNLDGLWTVIIAALPAARQKQLERALSQDGWFKTVVDGFRTVPGVVRQVGTFITR
ncbi:GTPase family protein [Thiorhodovibrio frisius]|uniref:Putative GTPase n=1 Tax=Thiorhodovibrio frisius TaxID=631362 RepID=H8YVD3_9GAMM|nr:GTPase [Thiorhodovibrio frisius]EIC23873.1 putative GTPase [Thiorhodovibrio frisius]WPL23116.1 GTP-binding protein Der [Thiorhodovibrio frisius]